MMTRSIVGRFLIVAVLLVSLGVISQAALIISRQTGKTVAKAADAPPAPAAVAVLASPAAAAAPVSVPAATAVPPAAEAADSAPVRVVYPGPLGDVAPPRKIADAAPASPLPAAPAPVAPAPVAAPAAPTVAAAVPAAPAATAQPATPPAQPAPVVVASAEADAQPTPDTTASAKGGVDLNSASVDALNHLGGGHIGQTIVKHRPYHSVEDLVRKRVVRRSIYEQIKDQLAAD